MYTQLEHLDVSDKMLQLSAGELYKLDLRLPYPVFGDRGGAKFDKQRRVVSITIPVQPPPPPVPSSDDVEEEPSTGIEELGDDEPAESEQSMPPPPPQATKPVDHSRWLTPQER